MQREALKVMWYSDGIRRLKIAQKVLGELWNYEQRGDRNESGGVLLGLAFKDYDEILGMAAPSRDDKARLFSFIRRKNLGEWHTHLGGNPAPSGQDRRMIENALRTTLMEIDYLYLVIAGSNRSLWIGRQEMKGLKMIEPE
jgi:proteasome lid subunit RPN8/RPN11